MTNFIHHIVDRHLTPQNHIKPRIKGLYERESGYAETTLARIKPGTIDEADFVNRFKGTAEEQYNSEFESFEGNSGISDSYMNKKYREARKSKGVASNQERLTTVPEKTSSKDPSIKVEGKPSDDESLIKDQDNATSKYPFAIKNLLKKESKDKYEESIQKSNDSTTKNSPLISQKPTPATKDNDKNSQHFEKGNNKKQESSVLKRFLSGIIAKQNSFKKSELFESGKNDERVFYDSDRVGNSIEQPLDNNIINSRGVESEMPLLNTGKLNEKHNSEIVPENSSTYSNFSELKNKKGNETERKLFASGPLNVKIQGSKVEAANNQVVQVNIGQIIVKANKMEKPPTKVVKEYKPEISLNDYLNKK